MGQTDHAKHLGQSSTSTASTGAFTKSRSESTRSIAANYLGEPKTDNYDILRAENGSYTIGAEHGNTNAYYQLW